MNVTATTSIFSDSGSTEPGVLSVISGRVTLTPRIKGFVHEAFATGRARGLDPLFVIVQAIHETGWFTSPLWLAGNSGGIGIWGSEAPNPVKTSNGFESAQIHVANLIARTRPFSYPDELVNLPLARDNAGFQAYVARVLRLFSDPSTPKISQWDDFNTPFGYSDFTYAADPGYTGKLLGIANLFITGESPEVTTVTYTTKIPGIEKPVVTTFPIIIRIVNASVYPNVNPQIPASNPRVWIEHEAGNYSLGANAASESNYLNSGAEGREAGYHFSVDDINAYCMIPVNFLTWQAADGFDGPGNNRGISCELAVGQQIISSPSRKLKSRKNAAELAAVISEAAGVPVNQLATRHYDWNYLNGPEYRHKCPELMITEGYWATFVADVETNRAAIRAGNWPINSPVTQVPVVTYVKTSPILGLNKYIELNDPNANIDVLIDNGTQYQYVHDAYEAVRATPRLQKADVKNSPHTGPLMKVGETAIIMFTFNAEDGLRYGYSAYATRFLLSDFKRIED